MSEAKAAAVEIMRLCSHHQSHVDEVAVIVGVHLATEREACAKAAEAEKVDAEATGDESDRAYNRACDDIAAAIRARGAK